MYCFSRFCIICVSNNEDLIDITFRSKDNINISYLNMLALVFPKLTHLDSNLQRDICKDCRNKLTDVYNFYQKCSSTLTTLEKYISLLDNRTLNNGNFKSEKYKRKLETYIGYTSETSREIFFEIKRLKCYQVAQNNTLSSTDISKTCSLNNLQDADDLEPAKIIETLSDTSTVILKKESTEDEDNLEQDILEVETAIETNDILDIIDLTDKNQTDSVPNNSVKEEIVENNIKSELYVKEEMILDQNISDLNRIEKNVDQKLLERATRDEILDLCSDVSEHSFETIDTEGNLNNNSITDKESQTVNSKIQNGCAKSTNNNNIETQKSLEDKIKIKIENSVTAEEELQKCIENNSYEAFLDNEELNISEQIKNTDDNSIIDSNPKVATPIYKNNLIYLTGSPQNLIDLTNSPQAENIVIDVIDSPPSVIDPPSSPQISPQVSKNIDASSSPTTETENFIDLTSSPAEIKKEEKTDLSIEGITKLPLKNDLSNSTQNAFGSPKAIDYSTSANNCSSPQVMDLSMSKDKSSSCKTTKNYYEKNCAIEIEQESDSSNRSTPSFSSPNRSNNQNKCKEYKCSLCLKIMRTENGLELHIRDKHIDKPYNCNICEARFDRQSSYHKHKLMHERRNTFLPLRRNYVPLRIPQAEADHERNYIEWNKYKCQSCGIVYENEYSFQAHFNTCYYYSRARQWQS